MRKMFDSTTPWEIPRDAEMVAYYVDGKYAWPQEWLDMFPNATKVGISAIGQRTAQVGDVEVGCIWPPANAVPWVRRARADGYDPTIYVNQRNDWAPTRQAFINAGEPEPHWWVAGYDGDDDYIPDDAVARQYAHPDDGDGVVEGPWETGKHYDVSVVRAYWPGIDTHAPGGASTSQQEDDMVAIHETLPASVAPNCVMVQCPVVGMSEPLPDGPETWAQVQIAVPNRDARVWGLYAVVTKGVSQDSEAILLAGPGKLPGGEVGETDIDPAPLGHDLYVPYWLPRGTFAVTAWYDSLRPVSLLITGGKTRKVSAKD